jgi:uncharacterized membrane protein
VSHFVAVGFDDEFQAEEVRLKLLRMQRAHLVDLEDAVVAVRRRDGTVRLGQLHNVTAMGALSGGFWGALIGLLFLNPLLGAAVGAAAGAVTGALSDLGINDKFMKELGQQLQPGSSALFVLVRRATLDKVLDDLRGYSGRVLHTSLSHEDENQLRQALRQATAAAAVPPTPSEISVKV